MLRDLLRLASVASLYGCLQPFNLTRDGFVKANVGGTSFYRVNYPSNVWTAFSTSIAAQVWFVPNPAGASIHTATVSAQSQVASSTPDLPLGPQDRGQLVDDIWTIAEGGIDPTIRTQVCFLSLPEQLHTLS